MAKRIKTVFSSDQIAHLWAHNLDEKRIARNSQGNHHFAGGLLYSYREPIARRIRNAKDITNPVFLIREFSYSVTTSRHQRWASGAVYGTNVFRHVKNIGENRWRAGAVVKVPHKENLAHYAEIIQTASIKFARSRADNKEWRLRELTGLIALANRYAEHFKLATRFATPSVEDVKATIAAIKSAAAKRTREQQETARKQAEHTARVEAERKVKILAALPVWLAGGDVPSDINYHFHNAGYALREATERQTDYLRVEGSEVVTQRGARVPLHHVKRAIPLILRVLESGKEWKRAEQTAEIRLADFRIDYIGNGAAHVGCHMFDRAEIERFAAILATVPDAPPAPAAE